MAVSRKRPRRSFALESIFVASALVLLPSALSFTQSDRLPAFVMHTEYVNGIERRGGTSSSLSGLSASVSLALSFDNYGDRDECRQRINATTNYAPPLLIDIAASKRNLVHALRQGDFEKGLSIIQQMFASVKPQLKQLRDADGRLRDPIGEKIDDVVQSFTCAAINVDSKHALLAVKALQLQWDTASFLNYPYDLVPKRTLLQALKALTLSTGRRKDVTNPGCTDAAYRILQRLVTNRGVRTRAKTIMEADFNMVLNAFCKEGRMEMAHRVMALQERVEHAPPLSPVAYSILLKGLGRLGDVKQIASALQHAHRNQVVPDIIMMNTLIDTYVECDDLEAAKNMLEQLTQGDAANTGVFAGTELPRPNSHTYNTLLKGFANNKSLLTDALALGEDMRVLNLWDHVTTNTLVHAALVVNDFCVAEQLLKEHTAQQSTTGQQHPNVEAYTELLDAYAKEGNLEMAVATLKTMRERGVEPNEITYTCLVAGMGRSKKIKQALQMLDFMGLNGVRPSCITYNALISGIVHVDSKQDSSIGSADSLDAYIDQTLVVLGKMAKAGVQPNEVTVATLVYALGRCSPPRVDAAKLLFAKLSRKGIISACNLKVVTALIQTCGAGGDIDGALEAFGRLQKPDVVAVNAFLDTCCRTNSDKLAFKTFDIHFRQKADYFALTPDVKSYSVLISSLLRKGTLGTISRASKLYNEMRVKFQVTPDTILVDMIIKAMVKFGKTRSLTRKEVLFVAIVLQDAEQIEWAEGQLKRRKRAIRAVLAEKLRNVWNTNESLHDLLHSDEDSPGELFARKGWNLVDSGFRIIGGSERLTPKGRRQGVDVDPFLESKGWNDVDSGFRII
jgi:pentatricopeptide repeat protein